MFRDWTASFTSGFLFSVGLAVAGMTQPSKIIGFLDVFGAFDPTLLLVMAGAIAVYLPAHRIIVKRNTPLFAARFLIPDRKDIDVRLLLGSALFGVGWGLGGFCPGPGLVSLPSLHHAPAVFVGTMVAGMVLFKLVDEWLSDRKKLAASAVHDQPSALSGFQETSGDTR